MSDGDDRVRVRIEAVAVAVVVVVVVWSWVDSGEGGRLGDFFDVSQIARGRRKSMEMLLI